MSNDQTTDQSMNPMLMNSHPLLRELSHHARQVRIGKHQDRYLTAFQFTEAPNHYLTIPHESLLHNLNPTLASLGNSSDALAWGWVWPWDIAKFAISASGDFIREIGRFPYVIKGFVDSLEHDKMVPEHLNKVKGLQSVDKVRALFHGMGNHAEFKSLYPNTAKLCRVAAGEAAGGPLPAAEKIESTETKVLKIIEAVLIAIGVTSGAIGTAAVAVLGIVIAIAGLVAGTAAIVTGAAATALIIAGAVVIGIILFGLAVGIIATILGLIIGGILIFQGGKSDDIDEYLTGELGLQLV